jgi:hypothetical protein
MFILTKIPPCILWDHMIVGMLSIRDLALLDVAVANNELRSELQVRRIIIPPLNLMGLISLFDLL